MSEKITAPWTPEQVGSLSAYQDSGRFHPFTCPDHSQQGILIPTINGWICQFCDYKQDWAHAFMGELLPPDPIMEMIEKGKIERMAIALARCEMVLSLGDAGVMAMSPERMEATFENAWGGKTDHDEHCRERFRALAKAAYGVISV